MITKQILSSTEYKCDFCNQKYSDYDRSLCQFWNTHNTVSLGYIDAQGNGSCSKYDLCYNCSKKAINFLKIDRDGLLNE